MTYRYKFLSFSRCLILISIVFSLWANAQDVTPESLFETSCATCHAQQDAEEIPSLEALQEMSANAILLALTDGAMRIQGNTISADQRVELAEYLSGGPVIERPIHFELGMCEDLPAISSPEPGTVWSGWGVDEKNSGYQTETGGLSAADIPNLNVKWAFGIPDVVQVRAQPAIYGERLYIGSLSGVVFALNANSGCNYWSFKAEAGIRTAISVADINVDGVDKTAIFFNDLQANTYAVNAETGELIWSVKVDDHTAAIGTGALKYHNGVLYVPTSGLPEEAIALGNPDYQCCSFRGSITALDANTGVQIWKTYSQEESRFIRDLGEGRELWGPSGAAIWNAPTIDTKRNLLYTATGNSYAGPESPTSNAIIAMDLDSGEIVWVNQVLAGDIWSGGCFAGLGGNPENPGCVQPLGPDFDFSASPVLTTTSAGNDIIVATQKSGQGYAFDPDNGGQTLWTYRWGVGAAEGGVYGTTSDGKNAYFAVADNWKAEPGGLHAVDLITGERDWFTPPGDLLCNPQVSGCSPAQTAAVTAMEGVVFSGSGDGGLRAYSTTTGEVIWFYNTNRGFDTVNGVEASGGSLDGPGAVIANGMVYVTAGNGGPFGRPGNVLIAFSINGD